MLETIGNYEAWKPRSVKMFKGRDGVDSPPGTVCRLKAGPLWDQELFLVDKEFNSKDMYYFKYLFKDPAFVAAVKEHWVTYKSNILGNGTYDSLLDYLVAQAYSVAYGARNLRRVIEKEIEDKAASLILEGFEHPVKKITVSALNGEFDISAE